MTLEKPFNEAPDDDGLEPLGMEHFYFPLGLLLAGLFISILCLLAEIIHNRLRKTDVPKLRQEEPSVTQSTLQLRVQHNRDVDDNEDTKGRF